MTSEKRIRTLFDQYVTDVSLSTGPSFDFTVRHLKELGYLKAEIPDDFRQLYERSGKTLEDREWAECAMYEIKEARQKYRGFLVQERYDFGNVVGFIKDLDIREKLDFLYVIQAEFNRELLYLTRAEEMESLPLFKFVDDNFWTFGEEVGIEIEKWIRILENEKANDSVADDGNCKSQPTPARLSARQQCIFFLILMYGDPWFRPDGSDQKRIAQTLQEAIGFSEDNVYKIVRSPLPEMVAERKKLSRQKKANIVANLRAVRETFVNLYLNEQRETIEQIIYDFEEN